MRLHKPNKEAKRDLNNVRFDRNLVPTSECDSGHTDSEDVTWSTNKNLLNVLLQLSTVGCKCTHLCLSPHAWGFRSWPTAQLPDARISEAVVGKTLVGLPMTLALLSVSIVLYNRAFRSIKPAAVSQL